MKRVLVIYNPVAGLKSGKNVAHILQDEITKNGYVYEWFETRPTGAQPLAELFQKKFFRVVVVGGDGTVAEVAAFLVKKKIKTPLVIIPQGTANLLARTLGLPRLSVRRGIRNGLSKPGKPIDVIRVNKKHYALTAIGKGYDTFVMKHTSRTAKKRWGFLAYAYTFVKNYFSHRTETYDLTIDGNHCSVAAKSIVVFNALPIPGFKLGGPVKPDDGILNIAVFNPRWFRKSTFTTFTGKKIVIHSDADCEFDLDGEVVHGETVTVEVVPSALRVVYTKSF